MVDDTEWDKLENFRDKILMVMARKLLPLNELEENSRDMITALLKIGYARVFFRAPNTVSALTFAKIDRRICNKAIRFDNKN